MAIAKRLVGLSGAVALAAVACTAEPADMSEVPETELEGLAPQVSPVLDGWTVNSLMPTVSPSEITGLWTLNVESHYKHVSGSYTAQRKGGHCVVKPAGLSSCTSDEQCHATNDDWYCLALDGQSNKRCYQKVLGACMVAQDIPKTGTLALGQTYKLKNSFYALSGSGTHALYSVMTQAAYWNGGCATRQDQQNPSKCVRSLSTYVNVP